MYDNEDGASPIDVEIEKVKLHEDYNPSAVSNDIAIITLKNEVRGSKSIISDFFLNSNCRLLVLFKYMKIIFYSLKLKVATIFCYLN